MSFFILWCDKKGSYRWGIARGKKYWIKFCGTNDWLFLNKSNEINWLVIFAVKVDPVWNKAFKVQDKLLYSVAYVEEGETVHVIGTLHSAKE